MHKNITVTLLISLLSLTVFSQNTDGKKHGIVDPGIWKEVTNADRLLKEKSYYNAIDIYKRSLKKQPDNKYISYKLGLSYVKSRDYINSAKILLDLTKLEDKKNPVYPYAWFYLGESQKALGQYKEARVSYTRFTKFKIKSLEYKQHAKFAKMANYGCTYALKKIEEDSNYVKINHLENDINHAYSDFAPFYHDEKLYFSTLRYDSVLSYDYGEKAFYPVQIYLSDKENNEWSEPNEVTELNKPDVHSANFITNPEGDKAFFSKCYNSHHNTIYCRIYETEKAEDGTWGKAHKLHHHLNSASGSSTQPTYGRVVKKKRKILDTLDVLYFSSDRSGGYGGFDIWYSVMGSNGKFKKPVNCGKKINSTRDEVTPYFNSKEKQLYFSSNYHKGFGGYDIFVSKGWLNKWRSVRNLDLPINSSYDDTYYNTIDEKDTLTEGFLVTNRPGGLALKSETCCDDIYNFQEYIPTYVNIRLTLSQDVILYDTLVTTDSTLVDSAGVEKWSFSQNKTIEKKIVSEKITGTKIGIIRKNLADKSKQIGRFNLKGLSQSIEWIDTNNTSGTAQLNLLQNKGYYLVVAKDSMETIIQELNTNDNNELNFAMSKIKEKVVIVDTVIKDTIPEITSTLADAHEQDDVKINQVFLLENMYFDTNKDLIKEEALPSLELLITFLDKQPKARIEISGHTDSQGNDVYNQDLSQRRAESIKQYLIEHKVKAKRLEAKGYGETLPIDTNDTAEGRKHNRRTEIKILSNK